MNSGSDRKYAGSKEQLNLKYERSDAIFSAGERARRIDCSVSLCLP
jgi:hypothetical protein